MELPIPTSLVDQSLLTQFHMKMKGCFTIGQLYQWRFVIDLYYQHFPPDLLKSRRYQINSRGCWPEYWLSHTFKCLKLFRINSWDMIKNVGFKLFIKVRKERITFHVIIVEVCDFTFHNYR